MSKEQNSLMTCLHIPHGEQVASRSSVERSNCKHEEGSATDEVWLLQKDMRFT